MKTWRQYVWHWVKELRNQHHRPLITLPMIHVEGPLSVLFLVVGQYQWAYFVSGSFRDGIQEKYIIHGNTNNNNKARIGQIMDYEWLFSFLLLDIITRGSSKVVSLVNLSYDTLHLVSGPFFALKEQILLYWTKTTDQFLELCGKYIIGMIAGMANILVGNWAFQVAWPFLDFHQFLKLGMPAKYLEYYVFYLTYSSEYNTWSAYSTWASY